MTAQAVSSEAAKFVPKSETVEHVTLRRHRDRWALDYGSGEVFVYPHLGVALEEAKRLLLLKSE